MSPWANRSIFAKLATILAIALVVGMGLCGLDYVLAAKGIGKSTEEFGVGPLDAVSLVVMIFSALGLALTLVVWFIVAIFGGFGGFRREDPGPQRLFDDSDKDGKER
jgi:hypothetical protein